MCPIVTVLVPLRAWLYGTWCCTLSAHATLHALLEVNIGICTWGRYSDWGTADSTQRQPAVSSLLYLDLTHNVACDDVAATIHQARSCCRRDPCGCVRRVYVPTELVVAGGGCWHGVPVGINNAPVTINIPYTHPWGRCRM